MHSQVQQLIQSGLTNLSAVWSDPMLLNYKTMKDYSIPLSACPHCGYLLDRTTDAFGESSPHKDDISMCIACGKLAMFNEDLTLRKPTLDELLKLAASQSITQVQLARSYIVGDKLKHKQHAKTKKKTKKNSAG